MSGTAPERAPQLAYSELQHKTHDEAKRQRKAAKIRTVLQHFLGTEDLKGLLAVDVGCSTGFTAAALAEAGADVIGLDIDVPGLASARTRFPGISWLCADGSVLPFPDASVDVVVFNHIYEHVVDADAVMSEIVRVLKADGVAYLAFGNKLQVIEPHYRLPFLSWLPHKTADRYVALSKRAPNYYERFRTKRDLITMSAGLQLWDYTYTVLGDSSAFNAEDMVPKRLTNVPMGFWKALTPIMPTFIWLGTPGTRTPGGAATRQPPALVAGRAPRG